jgi:hypothetical protein
MGLVLEALRASGCLSDTVRLVLADHGGHDFDLGPPAPAEWSGRVVTEVLVS